MRYREEDNTRPITMKYWHLNGGCTQYLSWTLTGEGTSNKLGLFKSMSDVVTPRFASRKAKGEVIMNPMSSRRCEIVGGGTGFHIKSKATSCGNPVLYHEYRIDGPWLLNKVTSGPKTHYVPPVVSAQTQSNLLREVSTCMQNRRGRQPSNLWETVAEARQIRSLLPGLASNALGVVTRLGKQRFTSATSLYLAARYGLMPIISDTENVLKALEKTVGKIRNKVQCENVVAQEATSSLLYIHDHIQTGATVKTSQRFYAKCISIDEVDMSMANRIGFTAKGLITLPWELLTLSFVVDWFVNVGDYLGAITPALGWNQLGSILCVTDEKVQVVTSTGSSESDGTYQVLSPVMGSATIRETIEWRQPPLAPSIVVRPKFGLFDGGLRDADAFALAGQRLARLAR